MWQGHIPFAYWLVGHQKPDCFVELGTHNGGSYFAICDSVKDNRLNTQCFAVDTWEGDPHTKSYTEDVFEFVSTKNMEFSNFSTLLRMRFEKAVNRFEDASIDLLHIDGFHTYEAVRNDYETWLPKMKQDGIILFHDTEVVALDFGVKQFWEEIRKAFPGQTLSFKHSFGLGVLSLASGTPISDRLNLQPGYEAKFVKGFKRRANLLKPVVKLRHALGFGPS
jgi:hypothetical protein